MKRNKLTLTTALLLLSMVAKAQEPEMADTMRSNGKIYVVVAIVLVVLVGFIAYLISIDRKVTKLENLLRNKDDKKK